MTNTLAARQTKSNGLNSHATFLWTRTPAGSEAGACTADDPVNGNFAIADDGSARTNRAGDAGERGPRTDRGGSRFARRGGRDPKPRRSDARGARTRRR